MTTDDVLAAIAYAADLVRDRDQLQTTTSESKNCPRRQPHPELSGSMTIVGDIIAPAFDESEWNDGDPFFPEGVLGGWQGEPLTRGGQGDFEQRDKLN